MPPPEESRFVSRAGLKLEHALVEFDIDVVDLVCADFGCNVGGFTDCLLQRGAARVYALDTGYGTLAWKLRNDARVVVMERTNALHADFPAPSGRGVRSEGQVDVVSHPPDAPPDPRLGAEEGSGVDLVTIDLAWTPQRLAVPAALRWLKPSPASRIITLIKPHYELEAAEKKTLLHRGALDPADARRILDRVLAAMPALGADVLAHTTSPLAGRKSSARRNAAGNVEFLALLAPRSAASNRP